MDDEETKDITAPPSGNTHEATTPPGNSERDEADIAKGEDKLGQIGAGH